MTTPVPARAHATMSVAERELTFDSLVAEFAELEDPKAAVANAVPADSEVRPALVPDASAPTPAPAGTPRAERSTWVAWTRAAVSRLLAATTPEVLKLSGLIAVAALSLILVFVALSR